MTERSEMSSLDINVVNEKKKKEKKSQTKFLNKSQKTRELESFESQLESRLIKKNYSRSNKCSTM